MLPREPICAAEAQPSSQRGTATTAVRRALELLGRASVDWRNGDGNHPGPLHWPVSVNLARRALREALEALESPAWLVDSQSARCPHCGGTGFQGDDPCEFCSATGRDGQLEDALRGSVWWNAISPTVRRHWLEVADSAVPADAWVAYKRQQLEHI